MRISLGRLEKRDRPIKIGGVRAEAFVLEDSEFILRSSTGNLHPIQFSPIWVLGPPVSKDTKLPVPGILGDDFISLFTLVVVRESHGGSIYFTDERVGSVIT